jgi:4-diphosphocytidyl-2-C-methyl-D-erythritol kinase
MMLMLTEKAFAKLNLYLHVLGRREDGYHVLDSLVAFADVHDTLHFDKDDHYSLDIDGPFGEPLRHAAADDNLITRAIHLLAEATGNQPHMDVRLIKNLPVASGIGGGSADAAAALRGAARMWGVAVDDPRVLAVAAKVGADVPVCVTGGTAYFAGIGDLISPAPALPACHIVLANPGRPLSTPQVFKAFHGPFSAAARLSHAPAGVQELAAMLKARGNDLTHAATSQIPQIADVLAALRAEHGCLFAGMLGSGATCWGLFGEDSAAEDAADSIAKEKPDWWVVQSRLLKG